MKLTDIGMRDAGALRRACSERPGSRDACLGACSAKVSISFRQPGPGPRARSRRQRLSGCRTCVPEHRDRRGSGPTSRGGTGHTRRHVLWADGLAGLRRVRGQQEPAPGQTPLLVALEPAHGVASRAPVAASTSPGDRDSGMCRHGGDGRSPWTRRVRGRRSAAGRCESRRGRPCVRPR